jgi:hypothetical protein
MACVVIRVINARKIISQVQIGSFRSRHHFAHEADPPDSIGQAIVGPDRKIPQPVPFPDTDPPNQICMPFPTVASYDLLGLERVYSAPHHAGLF